MSTYVKLRLPGLDAIDRRETAREYRQGAETVKQSCFHGLSILQRPDSWR